MAVIHFCLLCHTEGTPEDFEIGIPPMLTLREKIERNTGRKFPLTWALGTYHSNYSKQPQPAVFDEHRELFKKLLTRGDEIGLHPHGVPDENNVMKIDPFIQKDTTALINAGFPKPKTFVAGTWSFYPSSLKIIEQEGYCVDSSVAGGKKVKDGIVLYEYPPEDILHPIWRRPYRISRKNVLHPGHSNVIEILASGHLKEFEKGPNEDLVWKFFRHHISNRFKMRWELREQNAVDVFEVFWHPFELIKNRATRALKTSMLERFEEFLMKISTWEDVQFSTVYQAAMDWNKHKKHES